MWYYSLSFRVDYIFKVRTEVSFTNNMIIEQSHRLKGKGNHSRLSVKLAALQNIIMITGSSLCSGIYYKVQSVPLAQSTPRVRLR